MPMADIHTIYVIHHTHTDIGFTHDQPILWEMQRRFIDAAIDAAERDAHIDGPEAFRWTCETTAPLLHWFRHASDKQIERLVALEKAGRIEATAQYLHLCPLIDLNSTIQSL